MHEAPTSRSSPVFLAYTGLGYVALSLHNWVFVTDPAAPMSGLQSVLIMANLIAGSWCFMRALFAAWQAGNRPRPG
jgi:hypothetical protein